MKCNYCKGETEPLFDGEVRWYACHTCGCHSCDAVYGKSFYGKSYVESLLHAEKEVSPFKEEVEGVEGFSLFSYALANHRFTRDLVADNTPPREDGRRRRFLDVGCGHGATAALLKGAGWFVRTFDVCRDGRPSGVTVADSFKASLWDVAFHAVLLREVLEHVEEPGKLLAEVRKVLTPAGTLVLSTPLPLDYPDPAVYGAASGHLTIFSQNSVEEMLKGVDLHVSDVVYQPSPHSPSYLCSCKKKI